MVQVLSKEGLQIATVKHAPHQDKITDGNKDTDKHLRSGAIGVVLSAPRETTIYIPDSHDIDYIIDGLEQLVNPDIVLIEGYKHLAIPKIAVGNIDRKEPTIHRHVDTFVDTKNKVEREFSIQQLQRSLGGSDCGKCGYDSCRKLAIAIVEGNVQSEPCSHARERDLQLVIDGNPVSLSDFPATMIESGIRGLVKSLNGVDEDFDQMTLKIRS